jgi:hypothetical protein
MQFRIRSLMILVISASIVLATWRLIPEGRIGLLYFALGYAVIGPAMFLGMSRPAPWSMKRKVGFFAYCLSAATIYAAIIAWTIVYDPGLPQRMATWPG